jgi:signal transduction histidine kinase
MDWIPVPHIYYFQAIIAIGFLVFGVYVYTQYRTIGAWGLSVFSILWGLNFIVNAGVTLALHNFGLSSGYELVSLSFSSTTEVFLIGTSLLRGFLTACAIFVWLWFVLSYTVRLQTQDKLAIGAVTLVVIIIASLNGFIGSLASFDYIRLPAALEGRIFRLLSLGEILGTGLAIGAGTGLLYRASQRHSPFNSRTVPSLVAAVILPYLVRYLYQFGVIPEFNIIHALRAGGLLIGLVGLIIAVQRYKIFDQLPASQAVGRKTSFEETSTAFTVLDNSNRIVDYNSAAEELFDFPEQIIGNSINHILPEAVTSSEIRQRGTTTFRPQDRERIIEAETTLTTDERGQEFGRIVAYNDITEERRRKQRLEVLNRVLRHNLRNTATVANSYTENIAQGHSEADEVIHKIQSSIDDIVGFSEKAREIEKILDLELTVDDSKTLVSVTDPVIEAVSENHPSSTITSHVPSDIETYIDAYILSAILREVLTNAAEHAPEPTIEVTFDASTPELRVTDNGPGIPDHEIKVLEEERETALEHGSGLGLWLIKWGVSRLDGQLHFETSNQGTTVSIILPERLFVEETLNSQKKLP